MPAQEQVPATTSQFPFLVGRSEAMKQLLRQIAKVAQADTNVCIYGESGTGKELVARAVHYSSPRAGRPLVVFDCTAVPEGLMESEMFGHVRGAFTSAVGDRVGAFQLADGGSFFLDEVGELTLALQAKLLRVIQSREFRKVGGSHPIKVDVRIICATNRNLENLTRRKQFREDLFYRLEVIAITLPPLRNRKEDIPLLVDHFIQKFNRNSVKQIRGVSARFMGMLLKYHWPGNVRELENCIERAVVLTESPVLDLDDLSRLLSSSTLRAAEAPAGDGHFPHSLREAEQQHIIRVLQAVQGNRTRAAKLLGLSVRTLYYRMKSIQHDRLPSPERPSQRVTASAAPPGTPRPGM
jgi:Nif-specific regulatory protein